MNKLILVAVAATAASGIAAAPAVAGLSHNPSFSHQLPVRVPSGAQTVQVADEHHRGKAVPSVSPSATASRGREAEPGDDRGVDATPSPRVGNDLVDRDASEDVNDDHGVHEGLEPGDDNGHDGQVASQPTTAVTTRGEPEPGDDRGGALTAPSTSPTTQQAEKGDDRGGASGGSGSGRGSSGHHDG